ncbi:MAG: 3-hydroxyacyl-CoA dehydrogenase NAD-binding domain-containing protein [Actinobacteria bacterium]|nr:3-hydroxyacyl-CoA dehydrogenase NAD-binding domain-containing protein [Actinomycetota bacterium]
MQYREQLKVLAKAQGRDFRIALVGAGQMGRGFASQSHRMGLAVAVISDIDPARIKQAYADLKLGEPVISVDVAELNAAIEAGKPAGTTDANLISQLNVDVVVEATGVPEIGAKVAYNSLINKKHVAVLNVECDVTVGPILAKTAEANGVLYSVCHGDEPVEAKELVDFARDLSFEVVCAGKGKNNPFEPLSNPDTVADRAAAKHMNPKMLASFTDGSKTMIEMAALANATGLRLTQRGMIGPAATVKTLHDVFALKADGGVLEESGVVEYCTGDVAPGVFVIVKTDSPYVAEEMSYLSMGAGPYFALYRPYHLASVEAPLTVAKMLVDGRASLVSGKRMTEVIAATKKVHQAGDKFDGIGGYSARGVADKVEAALRDNLVPIGILQGAIAKREIPVGAYITYDDVELDQTQTIYKLRQEQDALGL